MFEISKLKELKLSELQEIAQKLSISKYKSLKKLDLVYKILDHQADNPSEEIKQPKQKLNQRKPFKKKPAQKKNQSNNTNDSNENISCLLYTSPSPRDRTRSRMPSSA